MTRHATDRKDWTFIAKCPNNGDCQPIIDNDDAPDDPDNCEHLSLEASATNTDVEPSEAFPIDNCPVCGAELMIISQSEPTEVLE